MRKLNNHQVSRAGEHFVAAELHRRGAYAVTFAGNMPDIDILASDMNQDRTVAIQVKTKRSRTWQTRLREWLPRLPEVAEKRFWIFVELREPGSLPSYFVVPEQWIQSDIDSTHATYLQKHGGRRARTPESRHHTIAPVRIEQWRERWELLGIFGDADSTQDVAALGSKVPNPRTGTLRRKNLQSEGFRGFIAFKELVDGRIGEVPDAAGVYAVLRETSDRPQFLAENLGGRFKGKDPTVDIAMLRSRWVDGAHVIYLGLASRLRRRIRELARFGGGAPVGHWGGRLMWQLGGSEDFVVAWRETPQEVAPREAELELLARFRKLHGDRSPFANMAG